MLPERLRLRRHDAQDAHDRFADLEGHGDERGEGARLARMGCEPWVLANVVAVDDLAAPVGDTGHRGVDLTVVARDALGAVSGSPPHPPPHRRIVTRKEDGEAHVLGGPTNQEAARRAENAAFDQLVELPVVLAGDPLLNALERVSDEPLRILSLRDSMVDIRLRDSMVDIRRCRDRRGRELPAGKARRIARANPPGTMISTQSGTLWW